MQNNHDVVLHFSDTHVNYYTAWCYVTNSDKLYLQSVRHPDVKDGTAPKTSNACQANCHKRKTKNTICVNKNKKKKLANKTVSDIIYHENIKNKTELYALAQTQRNEGKDDLYTFLINKTSKKIEELICTIWDWNILIIGPANCVKTFLLKPLSLVYRSFVNPATSTFAWVGAEQAELLFINDLRWSPEVIPWHDLLLLLVEVGSINEGLQILLLGILFQRLCDNNIKFWTKKSSFIIFIG